MKPTRRRLPDAPVQGGRARRGHRESVGGPIATPKPSRAYPRFGGCREPSPARPARLPPKARNLQFTPNFWYDHDRIRGRNGLGTAHFFLAHWHGDESGRVAGEDVAPDGVRAGRLGDVAQGPVRARLHRQAEGRRRRGLRARQPPAHAALRRRKRRFRPPRGVVARARQAAQEGGGLRPLHRRRGRFPAEGACGERKAHERYPSRPRGRRRPRTDCAGNADDPARRHRSRAARPQDRVEKGHESRTAAAGRRARARKERGEGDRLHRAGVGACLGDEEALHQRRGRRARIDQPRDRRLRFVQALDGRARRGARGARLPDRDHRRGGARPGAEARRRDRGAARAGGVRPHRRAGGEAGDPAEDPRRGARADPQRFPRARGQPADRHGEADRARQRDRRIRSHRGRDPARPADPEGDVAGRRSHPRVRDQDRPHREGTAAHPVADRARVPDAALRARGSRDRGGTDRDQGCRPRPRNPREDRGEVERSRGSTRRAPASACAARA